MTTLNVWWDQYTPRVESSLIRDLLTLLTYGDVNLYLWTKDVPESLQQALDSLGVTLVKKPGEEAKVYQTLSDTELPEYVNSPIVEQLFLSPSTAVLTKPGTPLVVEPPAIVPAPPQLSPNHMVEPPRTRNTILSPWLTN